MSSIDSRVVEAKFDNQQFEHGIKTTLNSLDDLKRGLNLSGATKGLSEIEAASKRFSLAHISDTVDKIASKFQFLSTAATVAFATIVTKATNAGLNLAKSLTIEPITAGLREYETQLNAIQTILSNTQWQGTTMTQVNSALQELNTYSDKTIYNFSEMARNIGTFTAAGVKLDTSVNAIKGIANLAAISGSSSDQASTAMYQLSQALATGTVKLMDWNSIVNAGMGGKVFQESLKETARAHGVSVDAIIKKEGSFRDSLSTGWLSADILTETLSKFTGDLSAAQLKQMGYTDAQIKGILKMGKTAQDAATKVKTFHQLIGTLQEAAGSGWAQTWQLIFGDFEEAKTLWTNVNNVLGGMISNSAKARNKILGDWKKLGGRTVLIDTISLAFKELGRVLKPIRDAFRQIFPRKTGQDLYAMTVALHVFIENLNISDETVKNIKRTFAGFFAVLDIGWQIIKAGIKFIAGLFGEVRKGSGGFLNATGNVGDFLVALDQAIKKGDGLKKFFGGLTHILKPIIHLISVLANALLSVFDFNAPSAAGIQKAFSPLDTLGHAIIKVWDGVIHVLDNVWNIFEPMASRMGTLFANLGSAISDALGGINYADFLHTINTALFAGLVLLIKKFVGNLGKGINNPAAGFLQKITAPFDAVTGTMKTMQNTLRATTLLQIAAALGIMTLSVIGLSRVNAADLTRALTALTTMFIQLFASMAIFQRMGGVTGLAGTAAGLVILATAMRILVSSVVALSKLSWTELAKGLSGLIVILGGLTLAVRGMSGETGGMIRAGIGLTILAAGIRILVTAVTALSGLSWGQMAKGLTGIAALLVALTLFTKFSEVNKGGIAQSVGLVLLASAIKILASAVLDFSKISWGGIAKGLVSITAILAVFAVFSKSVGNPFTLLASGAALIMIGVAMNKLADATAKFATLSWGQMAKGLVSMAGALTLIALALNALPPTSLLSAAAIIVVASSLGMIADALGKMGGMTWGEIAKGLVTLAAALGLIIIAMAGMTGALPGALATLVVATSLRMLTPVLTTLGKMKWSEIVKGLVTLAGVFAVLGVAGLLLTPVVPTLLGLGAAIALVGIGVALAGAGVLLFSIGLTALATSGAAAALAIVAIVTSILGVLPVIAKELALTIVALAVGIAQAAPQVFKAMTAVAVGMLHTIIDVAPLLIRTIGTLMVAMAAEIAKDAPQLATSGIKLMIGLLNALKSKMPSIVSAFAGMIASLLSNLAANMPKMVRAGVSLIVSFLNGIADNIDRVITSGANIIIAWIKGIGKNAVRIANAALDTIVDFINGIADAIDKHNDDFRKAGMHMATAILDGMTFGLSSKVGGVVKGAMGVGKKALKGIGGVFGIHSPSKETYKIGQFVNMGLANGLDDYASLSAKSAYLVGDKALAALQKSISEMSLAFIDNVDVNPSITPVLDLSNIKRDSDQIGTLLNLAPIAVDSTYSTAKSASSGYEANKAAAALASAPLAPGESQPGLTFVQNNISPKALSSAEIYRQTKNQLSVVKKGAPTDA